MEPYPILLAVLGLTVLVAAVLPNLLERLPVSLPMVVVAIGMVVFALPVGLEAPRPGLEARSAERLTEFVVIVSLMGAGLKLRRPVGWRSWNTTWRLLGITMPLTVVAVAVLGQAALGLPLATAILLGAVLAPTDPVLASDVQLAGPGPHEHRETDDLDAVEDIDEHAGDEVRFALTSEAGLNDGLAFPITNLAIAIAAGGSWFVPWLLDDVLLKLSVGVVVGLVLGRLIGAAAFAPRSRFALASTGHGFVALGATLAVYGITEMVHGYGFLAVFIAAVVIRRSEVDHEYQTLMHDFAETLERLASVLFLLLLGGAVVDGALRGLTTVGVVVAVVIVVLIRPLTGWVALLGDRHDHSTRAAIAFFGIRGMGTIYYLAHAVTEDYFPRATEVWAVAVFTILVSVVVHGITATPVLARLDSRRRERVESVV
ncbi:MAG: cation:proton antiporter [Ilumatobacter fluminis]|uniref:cation:proton antiporter n=1 Tax=Ilumatobacter fluminis TaxID=467091 RepID=UPI0032EC285B